MMRAVIMREFVVVARKAAVPVSACVVGMALTAFVWVWSPGVPVLAPMNLYQQTRLILWILLASMLPWTASRACSGERGDTFAELAAFAGLPPAVLLAGRALGVTAALAVVVIAGLPALVLAQQAAAIPLVSVLGDLVSLGGLLCLAASTAVATAVLLPGRVMAWLASGVATVLVVLVTAAWVRTLAAVGLASALLAAVLSAAVLAWAQGALRHRRQTHAV